MAVDWADGDSITVTEYYDVREDGIWVWTTLEPEWRKISVTILPPPTRWELRHDLPLMAESIREEVLNMISDEELKERYFEPAARAMLDPNQPVGPLIALFSPSMQATIHAIRHQTALMAARPAEPQPSQHREADPPAASSEPPLDS